MAKSRRSPRIQKRFQQLVTFARREGWDVDHTPGGHLKFSKPGCGSVYASATTSDQRAEHNARAQLRRSMRQAAEPGMPARDSHD